MVYSPTDSELLAAVSDVYHPALSTRKMASVVAAAKPGWVLDDMRVQQALSVLRGDEIASEENSSPLRSPAAQEAVGLGRANRSGEAAAATSAAEANASLQDAQEARKARVERQTVHQAARMLYQESSLNLSPTQPDVPDVFDEALKKSKAAQEQEHSKLWHKMENKMTGLLSKTLLVGDAFDAWVEWAVRQIRVEMLFTKAAKRMMFKLLYAVLDEWWTSTVKMRRTRAMATRRMHRKKNRVFRSWRENAHSSAVARHIVGLNAKVFNDKEESDRRVVMAVLQKILKRAQVRVLNRWRSFVLENKALRQKCNSVVRRIRITKVAAAMTTWITLVAEVQTSRNRMMKVSKRILHMKVSTALSRWVTVVVERKDARNMMIKVIRRTQKVKVACSYRTWTGIVQEAKQRRHQEELESVKATHEAELMKMSATVEQKLVQKVIKRIKRVTLAAAYGNWKRMTHAANQGRHQHEMEHLIAMQNEDIAQMRVAAVSDASEIERLKAELASCKADQEAFEKRLDSLMGLADFAAGAERLRKPVARTASPRSSGSPITVRADRAAERSALRARAAAKSVSE